MPDDQTDFLRKYGSGDMAPDRKAKPAEPLFTPTEAAEMRRFMAEKADRLANEPYLGRPEKPPLHADPLVCEIAEMLLKSGVVG